MVFSILYVFAQTILSADCFLLIHLDSVLETFPEPSGLEFWVAPYCSIIPPWFDSFIVETCLVNKIV